MHGVHELSRDDSPYSVANVVKFGCQLAQDDPVYRGDDDALARLKEIRAAFVVKPLRAPIESVVGHPTHVDEPKPKSASNEKASWEDFANCLGMDGDLFFPDRGASTRKAKETCRGCVVREDCLDYALANGETHGIWGGTSERERRRLRKQRAIARAATIHFA